MRCDILIHNGMVVPMNRRREVVPNGFIGVTDGHIAVVDRETPDNPPPSSAEYLDAGGCVILPGLINTHTHLPMTLFRGLADDLPLMTWLNEHIFPAEARFLNPDTVHAGTLLACAEMMLSGTTTCCDGYFWEEIVAQAVDEAGIRAVLAQGVIDFPAPGVPNPADNIDCARDFITCWSGKTQRITPSVFCHSPYTCSADTLIRAKALANETGVLFQIHAAESRSEYDWAKTTHGLTPIGYLGALGLLDQSSLLVHVIWTQPEDITLMASSGCGISHTPESAMKLASGVASIPTFRQAGIPIGLGTDGCASNNNLDMFSEMRFAMGLHRLFGKDPRVMDGWSVLKMATSDAARTLGLSESIGSIEPGKQADLVVLDTSRPHLTPMIDPVSRIVSAVRRSDVRDVMIGGEWVVRNHCLTRLDLHQVMEKVRFIARDIAWEKGLPT